MAQARVAVLTRHLVSAPVTLDVPEFDPGEVYLFLTRDNVELRARMLDHLKVRRRDVRNPVHVSTARCKPSRCSHGRYMCWAQRVVPESQSVTATLSS
jgi:hypothetical protein